MSSQHQKEKVRFQIERIAFFSDAVIAIAVTLLIIEIKAPHIVSGSNYSEQFEQLKQLLPEFISFIVSFSVIVLQWSKHHEMFGDLVGYNKKLIAINSVFLMLTAIIPFSTSYFALNNNGEFYLPFIIYGLSLFMLSFSNYLLFSYITNPKNNLYNKAISGNLLKWLKAEFLLFPVTILISLMLGFINFKAGLFAYVILMQFGFYINKQKRKFSQ